MPNVLQLPGLDRVINVCHQHDLPLELSPPLSSAPNAGDQILGQPFDPLLAALYRRMGGAVLGTFSLFRPDRDPERGLFSENESLRRGDKEPFRSTHLFAKETGFSYFLGTVPAVANAQSFQPVVYIVFYPGELYGIPIASNLDRFFDIYARYLELMVVDDDYVETGTPGVTFPWDVAHLIAQDGALIELIRTGRFNALVANDREAQEWVSTVLSMAR
jgi:hypothetical protein